MKIDSNIFVAILAVSAACIAGHALAAGSVTSVTTDKSQMLLGQSLNATVLGSIVPSASQQGCQMRISIRYDNGPMEVLNPGFLVPAFPQSPINITPAKAGQVEIIADGGGSNNFGWPVCQGVATSAKVTVSGLSPNPKTPVMRGLPQPVNPIVKPNPIPTNPGYPVLGR